MVTFGFTATSAESQNARQISVMKKILEERSKMFSHDVWGRGGGGGACVDGEGRGG